MRPALDKALDLEVLRLDAGRGLTDHLADRRLQLLLVEALELLRLPHVVDVPAAFRVSGRMDDQPWLLGLPLEHDFE
jgi:hypothetical protein